jgi:hypothetical protein
MIWKRSKVVLLASVCCMTDAGSDPNVSPLTKPKISLSALDVQMKFGGTNKSAPWQRRIED